MPEEGGDPLVPAEVYAGGRTSQIPRWQAWARAAQVKLEKSKISLASCKRRGALIPAPEPQLTDSPFRQKEIQTVDGSLSQNQPHRFHLNSSQDKIHSLTKRAM